MSKIKITQINLEPFEYLEYFTIPHAILTAQKFQLPIYQGEVEGLSHSIDSMVVTSDLQGICHFEHQHSELLGVVLAEILPSMYDIYFPDLKIQKSWAFLCGDLYANLEKRGSSGNPIQVWQDFSKHFQHVIGIAGNHDDFGQDLDQLQKIENIHFLESDIIQLDGIKIAGLSGVIGRIDKNFRRSESDYLKILERFLKQKPDITLTHLSPYFEEYNFLGEVQLTNLLEKYSENLLFCGHSHWETSQAITLKNATQVLNVDTKVFILINKNRNYQK
ncbi:metallophosphoesterase [Acinetobacter sp. Marseille-Q1618]|uniref:metallophosphoesterase family protein n=1 Tax=Acinetobacter sp. Marseille-Q1618 TaxID=2697502 RepID=UPI00156DC269|nr:metallophosphoesterase [Acinetobacter sp. Marseille-Q1618]